MQLKPDINNKAWESYYNRTLRSHEFELFRDQDRRHPYLKRLLKYAKGKKRSLEFGSGKGGMSLALKREYGDMEMHLLDFSQPAIQYSKELFDYYGIKGNFHCGGLLKLPYPDGYFDFIHGNTVLEHIEDTDKAVKELTRVLSKDGIGVITVPNSHRRFDGHDLYAVIHDIRYYSRTFYPRELEGFFLANSSDIMDRFGFMALYFYPSYPFQYLYMALKKMFSNEEKVVSGDICEHEDLQVVPASGQKISVMRRVMRGWGFLQAKFNLFMEHHEVLPYPWWILIGIVIKKR